MKATKYIVKITTETLSLDSVPALLIEVAESMRNENSNGRICKADGDQAEWNSSPRSVEI